VDELPADAEVAIDHAGPSTGAAISHRPIWPSFLNVEMEEFRPVVAS